MKKKICVICGKKYLPASNRQKYCSGCSKSQRAKQHLEWCRKHPESQVSFRKKNPAYHSKTMAKYKKTPKGRKYVSAKHEKEKKRGFGHHEISLPLKIEFDWHHVTLMDVVATPKKMHKKKHKLKDGSAFKLEGILG